MAQKKVSRKELLKEPDEFLTFSAKALRYVTQNPRQVIVIAFLVVACVAAAMGYHTYRKHRLVTSHELFRHAVRDYDSAVQAGETVPPEKLDQLFSRFNKVATQYSSLPAGEMALLYSGHVLFAKNDYKGALQRYLRMELTSLANEGLRELFWYHIAQARLALKEYDEAALLFEKLSKDTDSPYRREAYAAIARIYELTDRNKEAVQTYKQYLKMFPEAPDASFVKARIADLSVRG